MKVYCINIHTALFTLGCLWFRGGQCQKCPRIIYCAFDSVKDFKCGYGTVYNRCKENNKHIRVNLLKANRLLTLKGNLCLMNEAKLC